MGHWLHLVSISDLMPEPNFTINASAAEEWYLVLRPAVSRAYYARVEIRHAMLTS